MEFMYTNQQVTSLDYAINLPEFDNIYAAQTHYYQIRKEQLCLLEDACKEVNLSLDYSPESLIHLEQLYFHLFQNNMFYNIQVSIEEFEKCMSIYMCEIVVRNYSNQAEWVVKEYPFVDHKYTMGIRYGRYHLHFQNLFPDHYLSSRDASKKTVYNRFLRMKKKCQ